MKILILTLLFSLTSWAHLSPVEIHPVHPFTSIQTHFEFKEWCKKNKLDAFADFFESKSETELKNFLQTSQRILHPQLTRILSIEKPDECLNKALLQNHQQVEAAIQTIYERAKQDLNIYHPLQRAYYDYALKTGSSFSENKTLTIQGKSFTVLGTLALPQKLIDQNFEKASYADDIVKLDPTLSVFNEAEQKVIKTWLASYQNTIQDRYTGHNALLKKIRFVEIKTEPTPNQGTIDDFVQTLAFMDVQWWMPSTFRVAGESGSSADFNSEITRSLLSGLGPGAKRVAFWPFENKVKNPKPVIGQIHFALNYDSKNRMRSLEILARDEKGNVQPFMYEKVRVGSRKAWLPIQTIEGVPVKEACMKCHIGDDGQMKFRPNLLSDEKSYREVGYKSKFLISELMKY